jgi:hypothetical protein
VCAAFCHLYRKEWDVVANGLREGVDMRHGRQIWNYKELPKQAKEISEEADLSDEEIVVIILYTGDPCCV